MKKIKKSILNFAILLVVALCPLFLAACTKTPQNQLSSQQKYSKAIGASINKIKNYQTSALQSLNYQEVSEDLSSNLIMVDYMKRSGSSDSFDFPNLPFKATLLISDQMNVSGIHKYVVNDNKVSAQMVFTYSDSSNPASFSTADYEEIEVVYNFNSDSLVSFVWTSYDVETDSLFRYQYANGSLKMLVDDQSPEYFELKTSIKNKAQTLYNATLTNKTYDFTQQYKEVYNEYNPDSPLV